MSEKSLADSLLGPAKAGKQARIKKEGGREGPENFFLSFRNPIDQIERGKSQRGRGVGESVTVSARPKKFFSSYTTPRGSERAPLEG